MSRDKGLTNKEAALNKSYDNIYHRDWLKIELNFSIKAVASANYSGTH